jgi:hypothetical protein
MNRSKESLLTARWYSSWILVCAYIPVVVVYAVWIPLTLSGRFEKPGNDDLVFGLTPHQNRKKTIINSQSARRNGSNESSRLIERYDSDGDFILSGTS